MAPRGSILATTKQSRSLRNRAGWSSAWNLTLAIVLSPISGERMQNQTLKTNRIWATGFFEGEGCVRVNKPTKRNLGNLCVSISNTDEKIVLWFQRRWPGCFKKYKAGKNRKPAFMWAISSNKAISFLKHIQPFIKRGIVKTKIRLAIEYQRQKLQHSSYDEVYRKKQWEWYYRFRVLNQRGTEGLDLTKADWWKRYRFAKGITKSYPFADQFRKGVKRDEAKKSNGHFRNAVRQEAPPFKR